MFFCREGILDPVQAESLSRDAEVTSVDGSLPETLAILDHQRRYLGRGRGSGISRVPAHSATSWCVGVSVIAGTFESARGPVEVEAEAGGGAACCFVACKVILLAVLPTGDGSSHVFELPALALAGVMIVVSPLAPVRRPTKCSSSNPHDWGPRPAHGWRRLGQVEQSNGQE